MISTGGISLSPYVQQIQIAQNKRESNILKFTNEILSNIRAGKLLPKDMDIEALQQYSQGLALLQSRVFQQHMKQVQQEIQEKNNNSHPKKHQIKQNYVSALNSSFLAVSLIVLGCYVLGQVQIIDVNWIWWTMTIIIAIFGFIYPVRMLWINWPKRNLQYFFNVTLKIKRPQIEEVESFTQFKPSQNELKQLLRGLSLRCFVKAILKAIQDRKISLTDLPLRLLQKYATGLKLHLLELGLQDSLHLQDVDQIIRYKKQHQKTSPGPVDIAENYWRSTQIAYLLLSAIVYGVYTTVQTLLMKNQYSKGLTVMTIVTVLVFPVLYFCWVQPKKDVQYFFRVASTRIQSKTVQNETFRQYKATQMELKQQKNASDLKIFTKILFKRIRNSHYVLKDLPIRVLQDYVTGLRLCIAEMKMKEILHLFQTQQAIRSIKQKKDKPPGPLDIAATQWRVIEVVYLSLYAIIADFFILSQTLSSDSNYSVVFTVITIGFGITIPLVVIWFV